MAHTSNLEWQPIQDFRLLHESGGPLTNTDRLVSSILRTSRVRRIRPNLTPTDGELAAGFSSWRAFDAIRKAGSRHRAASLVYVCQERISFFTLCAFC